MCQSTPRKTIRRSLHEEGTTPSGGAWDLGIALGRVRVIVDIGYSYIPAGSSALSAGRKNTHPGGFPGETGVNSTRNW